MRTISASRWVFAGFMLSLCAVSCGEDEKRDRCDRGEEGCRCKSDETCDSGLVCDREQDECVESGGSAGKGGGGGSGGSKGGQGGAAGSPGKAGTSGSTSQGGSNTAGSAGSSAGATPTSGSGGETTGGSTSEGGEPSTGGNGNQGGAGGSSGGGVGGSSSGSGGTSGTAGTAAGTGGAGGAGGTAGSAGTSGGNGGTGGIAGFSGTAGTSGGTGGSSGSGGKGGTGGSSGSGGKGGTGGSGGSAGTTGGTGGSSGSGGKGCTEISAGSFEEQNLYWPEYNRQIASLTTEIGGLSFGDFVKLEFWLPNGGDQNGDIALGTGEQADYATCTHCVAVLEDAASIDDYERSYFATSGTISLDSDSDQAHGFPHGNLIDVTLREATFGPNRETAFVINGDCLHITNLRFDIDPEGTWTECPPDFRTDLVCDCGCGASDSLDCEDATFASCDYCWCPGDDQECLESSVSQSNNAVCE